MLLSAWGLMNVAFLFHGSWFKKWKEQVVLPALGIDWKMYNIDRRLRKTMISWPEKGGFCRWKDIGGMDACAFNGLMSSECCVSVS